MEPPGAVRSVASSTSVDKMAADVETISCVYPNCQISESAELYNVHLARCRQNWRGPVTNCPYNSAHVVPSPEERYHLVTCPDRFLYHELAECKEKLEVAKRATRSGNDSAKKQGCETFDVVDSRVQTAYFDRGGRYSKWRNVGPRLQSRYALPNDLEVCSSAGRGERSTNWRKSNVTGIRSGRRPGSGLIFASYRNPVAPSIVDDLSTVSVCGFSPWASRKMQSSSTFDGAHVNQLSRARWTPTSSSVVTSRRITN